jgi:hypothetical protein
MHVRQIYSMHVQQMYIMHFAYVKTQTVYEMLATLATRIRHLRRFLRCSAEQTLLAAVLTLRVLAGQA